MLHESDAKRPATRPTLPSIALLSFAVLAVCGCASVAPPRPLEPPRPPEPPAAEARTALPAALAAEQRWLQSWFQGTPVVIEQHGDAAVNVDVPREFCFDRGRSTVKPALAAVLDKVAESLRRRPSAHLALLAAPDDGAGTTPLALQRAVQVNRHLRNRGVPSARLGEPAATGSAAVQLRIAFAAP